MAPVRARMASRSVVLPLWNGPTSAMHRGPRGLSCPTDASSVCGASAFVMKVGCGDRLREIGAGKIKTRRLWGSLSQKKDDHDYAATQRRQPNSVNPNRFPAKRAGCLRSPPSHLIQTEFYRRPGSRRRPVTPMARLMPVCPCRLERLQRDGIRRTTDQNIGAAADADSGVRARAGKGASQIARSDAVGRREHAPRHRDIIGDADIETEAADRRDIGYERRPLSEHAIHGRCDPKIRPTLVPPRQVKNADTDARLGAGGRRRGNRQATPASAMRTGRIVVLPVEARLWPFAYANGLAQTQSGLPAKVPRGEPRGTFLFQVAAEALDALAGFLEVGGLGRVGNAEGRAERRTPSPAPRRRLRLRAAPSRTSSSSVMTLARRRGLADGARRRTDRHRTRLPASGR